MLRAYTSRVLFLSRLALQDCLAKHQYNQSYCHKEIKALVECCAELRDPEANLHCKGFRQQIQEYRLNGPADRGSKVLH